MVQKYWRFGETCWFQLHEARNIKPVERSFFQDVTPCSLVVGYRCFGASYRSHLQGSSVSSSPSSSFLRNGGTCPHGVTCRVQAISNAQPFCPLAGTELIHCKYRAADSIPLTAINRSLVADIRPTHNTFFHVSL